MKIVELTLSSMTLLIVMDQRRVYLTALLVLEMNDQLRIASLECVVMVSLHTRNIS